MVGCDGAAGPGSVIPDETEDQDEPGSQGLKLPSCSQGKTGSVGRGVGQAGVTEK